MTTARIFEPAFRWPGRMKMKATIRQSSRDGVTEGTLGLDSGRRADPFPELFAPGVLLPSQFFARFKRRATAEPVGLLMLAVLDSAVRAYSKGLRTTRRREKAAYDEACEWLMSDDQIWPFSFRNICEVLGIDADYLRRGLGCETQQSGGSGERGAATNPRPSETRAGRPPTSAGRIARGYRARR